MPARAEDNEGAPIHRRWLPGAVGAVNVLALSIAGGASAAPPSDSFRADDVAVFRTMSRLRAAALADCRATAPDAGWLLHDLSQYSRRQRQAIIAAFGLDRGPGVLDVVPRGPASVAGIAAGDILLSIDNRPRVGADATLPPRAFRVSFLRDGSRKDTIVRPILSCRVAARIVRSEKVNAYASASRIQVTEPMIAFLQSRAELAALLGHELAHVVLGHRPRAGEEAERAADLYSIRLLANAGYPLAPARAFWTRLLSRDNPEAARTNAIRLMAIDTAINATELPP